MIATAARLEAENNTLRDHTQVRSARFDEKVKALADCVGDRPCQTAAGHFDGWIRIIDERDLPACGGEATCIQNRLDERDAYTAGLATATGRMKDPLIAGMDLLDARNKSFYDRLTLKDSLVRFQSGTPDYTSEVDRFVVEAMMSSPAVFAAVKGISALDSDGGGGGRPAKGSDIGAKGAGSANQTSGPMGRLVYEAAPYHGKVDNALKSRAPKNGQEALNTSIQIKPTSLRRVGVDYESKEFVVFDRTLDSTYHGHVRPWEGLHQDMKRALQQAGVVDRKGNFINGKN